MSSPEIQQPESEYQRLLALAGQLHATKEEEVDELVSYGGEYRGWETGRTIMVEVPDFETRDRVRAGLANLVGQHEIHGLDDAGIFLRAFEETQESAIVGLLILRLKQITPEEQLAAARDTRFSNKYPYILLRGELCRNIFDSQGFYYSQEGKDLEKLIRNWQLDLSRCSQDNDPQRAKPIVKQLEAILPSVYHPHLRALITTAIGKEDDIFNQSIDLALAEDSVAFQQANAYAGSENPKLRRLGLIKAASFRTQEAFNLLESNFDEMLLGDFQHFGTFKKLYERLDISPYKGIAASLAEIDAQRAAAVLRNKLIRALASPQINEYWLVADTLAGLKDPQSTTALLRYEVITHDLHHLNRLGSIAEITGNYLESINYRQTQPGEASYQDTLGVIQLLRLYTKHASKPEQIGQILTNMAEHNDPVISREAILGLLNEKFYLVQAACTEKAAQKYIQLKNSHPALSQKFLGGINRAGLDFLGKLGSPASLELLDDTYNAHPNHYLRRAAGEILGYSRIKMAFDKLRRR